MKPSTSLQGGKICSCPFGYIGQYCEIDVCEGYCLNGGTCTVNVSGAPKCICPANWSPGGVVPQWRLTEYKGFRCERKVEKSVPAGR